MASALEAAAFGDSVQRWPLPAATTPTEMWWRAVAAGGQGRYAAAHADLARLRRTVPPDSALSSLAHSTTASLWRQLGWHGRARRWDGLALRWAGGHLEARADAMVGLAADALGMGRFGISAAALDAAGRLSPGSARHEVRLEWVSAELAMARGDGARAVRHARAGVALAEASAVSPRHRTKSHIVLAAALCTNADLDHARTVADAALADTDRWGLLPLRWAVASLLAGIGSDAHPEAQIRAIRAEAAALIEHRGGLFAP
jgi:hypothetical protein